MRRSSPKFGSETGATLVELMVVALIIIILATAAVINRGSANEQYQRQNAARQLKSAFERARFDSVKRRADGTEPFAQVEVRTNGFTLRTYKRESNGTLTPNDQVTALPSNVTIEHYSSGTLPMTVTFNRRGETAGGIPQFRVNESTSSTSEIVLITPTGTVNLLPGSSSIPSFTNPALAGNPASTDTIEEDVVVP